jgi:hypothetical protein
MRIMGMSKVHLEIIRWTSAAACAACWWAMTRIEADWAVLLFFGGFILGLPGAILTLHLHPPKWFKYLERPKR